MSSKLFISGFEVVYGSQPSQEPAGAIEEIDGLSNDINKDFGGDFVWITPKWSTDHNNAVTSFKIVIQDNADPDRQDLAKGAGGAFRYLIPSIDLANNHKITVIRLKRSDRAVDTVPEGYNGMTGDINKDRGKTFLYVIWASVAV